MKHLEVALKVALETPLSSSSLGALHMGGGEGGEGRAGHDGGGGGRKMDVVVSLSTYRQADTYTST